MIQIYADWLTRMMDQLRGLEQTIKTWPSDTPFPPPDDPMGEAINTLLRDLVTHVGYLELPSAKKQMFRLLDRFSVGHVDISEFGALLRELRIRITEDLGDRIFYCITDAKKIDMFFRPQAGATNGYPLVQKPPEELFDSVIVQRFPDCTEDLEETARCYIASCYTAAVFHLMRVVEIGVMEVAKLASISDTKPSWGTILTKVDQYVFRTEYKDLPDAVKPHCELLRALSNEMHGIQRVWRNRVSHVENKLIPVRPIADPVIAWEIVTAVQAFMRSLAERLPPTEHEQ